MASHTTTVTLHAQLHERIVILKQHVSEVLRFNENSLGLGPMLGLLLDHWENSPPDADWLRNQCQLYPKRGRPRKSAPASMTPRVAMRASSANGHELLFRKADEGKPHRIIFCKHCTMEWATWDFTEPPAKCPRVTGFSGVYAVKIWTKNELLAAGFEESEVAWLGTTP